MIWLFQRFLWDFFHLKLLQIFIKIFDTLFKIHFCSDRTWGKGFKLKQITTRLETKNKFFMRVLLFYYLKNIKNTSTQIKMQTRSMVWILFNSKYGRQQRKGSKRNKNKVGGQKDSDRDSSKKMSPLCGPHCHPGDSL